MENLTRDRENSRRRGKETGDDITTEDVGKRLCTRGFGTEGQRRSSICFRTLNTDNSDPPTVDFHSIPLDFDGDGDGDGDPNHSGEPEVVKPFSKSSIISELSGFAAIGSCLYCLGIIPIADHYRCAEGMSKIYRFDTTRPSNGWVINAFEMLVPRTLPNTIVMDGKLYIFGGLGRRNGPWAEYFDPCWNSSLPLPPPPSPSPLSKCRSATAALHSSKKILVASSASNTAYVYDVTTQVWEELSHNANFSRVKGEAAVVRNTTLCWFDGYLHLLYSYDLGLKTWLKGPIKGLDKVGVLHSGGTQTKCSLLSLDDNHLCLLWVNFSEYNNTYNRLIHCTKVRVSIDYDAHGTPKLAAFVLSSRSYLPELRSLFINACVCE